MDTSGNLYIANIGDGKLYKMDQQGLYEIILDQINGQPLGSINFVFIDNQDRLWVSVMTRQLPLFPAINVAKADGYIILIDRNGPRIVADNILWCNEVRMDKQEKFLYAAETWGNHILRFPVQPDGSLGDREIYGPADLGFGAAVDGFTFDAEGNIWATTFVRNGLMIISPEGEAQTVFEDPNQAGLEHMVAKIQEGQLRGEDFGGCLGTQVQFPSSITFGGPDLKTVYVGSLAMPYLLTFQSPVAGLPMRHWR